MQPLWLVVRSRNNQSSTGNWLRGCNSEHPAVHFERATHHFGPELRSVKNAGAGIRFLAFHGAQRGLLGSTLGETRWIIAIPGFTNTQHIISNIRTLQVILPGAMIWVPAAICFCIVCFIPVIAVDCSQFISLLPPGRMVLTRINILTNVCITLALFTASRCYIKRGVLADELPSRDSFAAL